MPGSPVTHVTLPLPVKAASMPVSLGLALKPSHALWVGGEGFWQKLQCNVAF
jgi:hypothetical protein